MNISSQRRQLTTKTCQFICHSTVCSSVGTVLHQKETSKLNITGLLVKAIRRWPLDSPHKGPVMHKVFSFHEAFMYLTKSGIFYQWLNLHPANERRRYKVTPSLIGWAQIYSQIINLNADQKEYKTCGGNKLTGPINHASMFDIPGSCSKKGHL